jgi:hypothetical protein
MSAISMRRQLARIGESPPVHYPRDFQTSASSLRTALLSTQDPGLAGWRLLFKQQFSNTGWSGEFQGLARGRSSWFFFTKSSVRGLDDQFREIARLDLPDDLRERGYDHIGDGDLHGCRVYAPVERAGFVDPVILVLDTALHQVGTGRLTSGQRHAPWCAVHPWNGLLYSSEDDDVDALYAYDPATFATRGVFHLYDATGRPERLQSVQGGCITARGHLYLTSGSSDDIRCYSMLNGRFMGRRHVDYSKGFPEFEEMEGIAVHDLRRQNRGCVHVAVLDNDWPSTDDLFLHHYEPADPDLL